MSKGFMVALSTVAIALIAFHAMAMAPVITDIPSPIVGDEASVTDPNLFVYPDALDLDAYVADDATADGEIQWSAYDSAGRYVFNGIPSINPSTEDPTLPGAKRIDNQVASGESDLDTDSRTVTVRDQIYSPLGLSNTDPGTAGIVASSVVTFFASDGSSYSSQDIIVYTDNDGTDRMSPDEGGERVYYKDWTASSAGATGQVVQGTATASYVSGTGLCLEVPLTGSNAVQWYTGYDIECVDGSVWLLRMAMSSNVSTVGTTPLWATVFENQAIAFGGESMFLDNTGGANAVGASKNFYYWLTPIAVLAPQYSGNFVVAFDGMTDMRLIYKMLDVDSGGYGAELDAGRVCMSETEAKRFDITKMSETALVENITTLTDAGAGPTPAGNYQIDVAGDTSSVSFAGGNLTVAPTDGNWESVKVVVRPGDKIANPGTMENALDNWPLTWEGNTTYLIQYEMSAPSTAAQSNPPDVVRVGVDQPTFELIMLNYSTPNLNWSNTPHTGTAQKFSALWYSHAASTSSTANHNRFRPMVEFATATAMTPMGYPTNPNGLTVHSQRVAKVTFPGLSY